MLDSEHRGTCKFVEHSVCGKIINYGNMVRDAITKECVPVSDETIKDSLVWNLVDVKVMRFQRAVVCIPFQVEKFYPCIEVLGVVGNSRGTNERWLCESCSINDFQFSSNYNFRWF
jgi:hypothetical protein